VISAHRFASANPRALATTRRSGFTLARRLLGSALFGIFRFLRIGSYESFDPSVLGHFGETSRCVLPTNATHYLTNCTRARGFLGSLDKKLQVFTWRPQTEPRRSMRFTTPSIASAGDPVFAFEKYSFPKPGASSPLLFRHPPLRCAPSFLTVCASLKTSARAR